MNKARLSPTTLAHYIKQESCERFLRFRLVPEDEQRLLRRWNLTIQPLTPLLEEAGAMFEQDLVPRLVAPGEQLVDLGGQDVHATLGWLRSVKTPVVLYQAALEGSIGAYHCTGAADLLWVSRDPEGGLHILVADLKATRQEKTEHRLQVAVYARLLQDMAEQHQLPITGLQGAVLTRQEDEHAPLGPETPGFELDTYLGIVERLVSAEDAVVPRVAAQPFESAFYHLSPKCDGCLYNALCMYDSAERMDLALTPHISAVEKRVLNDAGVLSLSQLAGLMELPEDDSEVLRPAAAQQAVLERLKNRWPVGPNLPFLVQRARSALRYQGLPVETQPWMVGAGWGSLPDDRRYPQLVKIFFDVQRDYLQDRLYLASALVCGPGGRQAVVECTGQPPTDTLEGELLAAWVGRVAVAVAQVAGESLSPLHLYCYSRSDQNALLEALKRHLSQVAGLPAFFDLLTQSAALSQPMISFLSEEVRERYNLGRVCLPLHDVARARGFDWRDEKINYFHLFRVGMFDNRREVVRLPDGSLQAAPPRSSEAVPGRFAIESASRFNSQIPLEYAYAAWGRLPDSADPRHRLEPYRQVSLAALRSFAGMRVQALAHIEASFRVKSRTVEKQPIQLGNLLRPIQSVDLAHNLREFLYIEHHTRVQASLLEYGQPLERRVQHGLALPLRCTGELPGGKFAFVPELGAVGLDPTLALSSLKIREGEWVVVNLPGQLTSQQILHGRLARVDQIGPAQVILVLLGVNFPESFFRYAHRYQMDLQPGQIYTIDPMADDLNADKLLEALDHVTANPFYDWLHHPPARHLQPAQAQAFYERFLDAVAARLQVAGRQLTARQREAVAGQVDQPLALVQGPPGTGKSYTLAWTVLARVGWAAVQAKPYRVLIACKTHNAINVALEALTTAQAQIGMLPPDLGGQVLFAARVYKVVNEADDPVPAGVNPLNTYNQKDSLENLLQQRYLIVGATTGTAYNLMRHRSRGGKEVDWENKTFDLVVIDEASQMSLPEGVLAGAFLKPDGQMIVVGDHRQMPPIIAHAWKDEPRHSQNGLRPFISLFEALLERDFPCVRLDESFRLPRELANFLRLNVYARDGIDFHSNRTDRLPLLAPINPYVDAVLHPDYPVVVIEHSEAASQQHNLLELALVQPLVQACIDYLSPDAAGSPGLDRSGVDVGVVVPHRAQKALLRDAFPGLAQANAIDTVERFQGDERDVIIVSATASDPDYVRSEAEFLLNLNRLNVAISRPRKKLIVVAARSVIDLLTSDLAVFEQSVIWKRLYHHYTPDVLLHWRINGHTAAVRGRKTG